MTYQQTLDYLYSQLPMFSRTGASAMTKDLSNTLALCELLGNPQRTFKTIHIGGTNGKGSTSHMLAAILQTAGYKTGLYTSPHLKDFRERIRINGEMIGEDVVTGFVEKYRADFEKIKPSFFEMTVALCFAVFERQTVDFGVIEVGLGGRLDSTNVITPLLSVITNIGWDHMNILGDTLPKIAAEKAGIIKAGVPVIISERQPEVEDIFIRTAARQSSPVTFASDVWTTKIDSQDTGNLIDITLTSTSKTYSLQLDLTGTYQLKNVKGVLCAVDELRRQGYTITDEHIIAGLRQVKAITGLHGRWETLSENPLTICDTGHNPDGIAEVLKNIARVKHEHLHFVIGMVNDKDSGKVLSMLPKDATYYFCKPDIPRGLAADTLQLNAQEFDLSGGVYPSVKAALTAAQKAARQNDLVFVGGSTFVVAEVV